MNYIVLDLEWNQCPLGKKKEIPELPFEIIEIGAVKLDEDLQFVSEFSSLIKPEVYHEIHAKTQEVINITMKDLQKGKPFKEAAGEFFRWCGDEYAFCIWGNLDLVELQRNMNYFGLEPLSEGPLKYYDVQKLFSLSLEDGKSRRTLQYAAAMLELEETEEFHSAINDARYTAKIMQNMDFKGVMANYSIDCYRLPKSRTDEVHVTFPTYSKYISRGFENKEDMMKDKEILSTRCYLCGKNCRKKIRWFSGNTKVYYGLASCNEHGYMKGKIKVKQADSGLFYAIKILKLVDEAGADTIRQRQNDLREKRRERRHKIKEEMQKSKNK